ncbi:hypothetical protein LCGC14_3044310, partial [marine sediment metagenome]
GDTGLWDKGLNAFAPPAGIQLFGRAVFLTFGVSITINKL